MPYYEITYNRQERLSVIVEADNEDEAEEIAYSRDKDEFYAETLDIEFQSLIQISGKSLEDNEFPIIRK